MATESIYKQLQKVTLADELKPFIADYHTALKHRAKRKEVSRCEAKAFIRFIKMYESKKYKFAPKNLTKIIAFVQELRFFNNDGRLEKLKLTPVQKFIVTALFGLRHKDGSGFVVNYFSFYAARRNGKSFLLSALTHSLLTVVSKYRDQKIILASVKAQTAEIVFDNVVSFIENDKNLEELYDNINKTNYYIKSKITRNKLELYRTGAGAGKTLDGHKARIVIIDESMLVPPKVVKTLSDGTAEFKDNLVITLSTAQFEIGGDNHLKYISQRKRLLEDCLDDNEFVFIAEAEAEDLKTDKTICSAPTFLKANPVLGYLDDGHTVKQFIVDKYIQEAKSSCVAKGFEKQNLVTKRLNNWYCSQDTGLCSYEQLMNCKVDYSFEDVINAGYRDWYIGLDLSSTTDLTTICFGTYINHKDDTKRTLLSVDERCKRALFVHFISFMPKNRLQQHIDKDKFYYGDYINKELILCNSAGGDNIDIQQVYQYILDTKEKYELNYKTIACDPYNISGIQAKLEKLVGENGAFILQNQSPRALSQYIEIMSQMHKDSTIVFHEEDIYCKAVTNAVMVRNESGFYSIEKYSYNQDNVRIDPVDACLDCLIAPYLDEQKTDTTSGDEAIMNWIKAMDNA